MMRGMKALITVMPLAGHMNPIMGLVAELIARGHSVTVYTGSRYCRQFAELGAIAVAGLPRQISTRKTSPPRFLPRGVRAGRDIDKPAIAAWVDRAGAGIDLRTGQPKPEAVATAVKDTMTDRADTKQARQIGAELCHTWWRSKVH
jgi:UDP:flavonoid glycosyltransferase YjiC (YdhE family)